MPEGWEIFHKYDEASFSKNLVLLDPQSRTNPTTALYKKINIFEIHPTMPLDDRLFTCITNFWSINFFATDGWKSGDSKNLKLCSVIKKQYFEVSLIDNDIQKTRQHIERSVELYLRKKS